jgi:S1-C subfamily serine protease
MKHDDTSVHTPPESKKMPRAKRDVIPLLALLLAAAALGFTLFPEAGVWFRSSLIPPYVQHHTGEKSEVIQKQSTPINANPITQPFASLIADVAENTASSVVNIDVEIQRMAPVQQVPDLFRYFFGAENLPPQAPYQQTGQGSGFVYDAAKGIVIMWFLGQAAFKLLWPIIPNTRLNWLVVIP